MDIKGKCVGMRLEPRGENDNHVCLRLMIKDDTNWFPKDFSISSYWIDDMLEVLNTVKARLDQLPDDPSGYGSCFKK